MRRFEARRALWALLPVAGVAILSLYRPAFLTGSERATYDTLLRTARLRPPDSRIVIVDIDDRSLSAIGQWPWRRDVMAKLVSGIRARGASAIALDVLFAEQERAESSTGSTDRQLAEALSTGRVVLGYALTFDRPAAAPAACLPHGLNTAIIRSGTDEESNPFFQATGSICNLPTLTRAAGGAGFMNAAPDSDGILRRVPLLLQAGGQIYPSLALAAVQTALGQSRAAVLRIANANTLWLSLGDREVPLDGRSHLLVRYRGTKRTFPYLSAADVLNGNIQSDAFANRIVFVGTTALGTREVVATPLDTLFAAVEVQATVADNLLRQDFLRRPEQALALETLTVVGCGALAIWLVSLLGLTRGGGAIALGIGVLWAGAAALFSVSGAVVSPLFPTLTLVATFAVMAGERMIFERRRADIAVADKATSRNMMIASLLSLTETRDAETGEHSRRTERNMRILASQLAQHPQYRDYLTPQRIDLISALAPLHDIGKVGVADRVLAKPGALTDDELREMRTHPVLGRDVIARAERQIGADVDGVMAMAKEIVYTHHEKWDGTGYPRGLRGADIPVAGRLMALVDVYDAVITRRRYQQAMSHDDAVKFITEGRGTHFDPDVVDAFVQVLPALRVDSLFPGVDAEVDRVADRIAAHGH
jgi:adenylate cyclase